MPIRPCEVTADSDPERRWIEIGAASSLFEAAGYYKSYCSSPPMGCTPPPRPGASAVFTVRVGEREYHVRRRASGWPRFEQARRQELPVNHGFEMLN